MKELMVVAIGGNSIIKDNASQSIEHQAQAVKAVAESVICAAPRSPTSGKGCR